MNNLKEITKSVLACGIVGGAIVSLFVTTNDVGARLIQTLGSIIIGYYFGASVMPFSGIARSKKK